VVEDFLLVGVAEEADLGLLPGMDWHAKKAA
jgi:hypothetical protein